MLSKGLPLILLVISIPGCGSEDAPEPDRRITFDRDGWPQPPEDWKSRIRIGMSRRYLTETGAGITYDTTIKVVAVNSSNVTIHIETWSGDHQSENDKYTLAWSDILRHYAKPDPSARILARSTKTIRLGERSHDCTVVEFEWEGTRTVRYYNSEVPAVFKAGCVLIENDGRMTNTIELVDP